MSEPAPPDEFRAWHALADLYHAYFTGLIMALVTRRGSAAAAEFVFRVFRRQHHERFLAGIEKFGLTAAPHAVAAAQYHYLSNQIGGVNVEYMRESDRKAWIRYPPPRWIWRGTAICAIPGEVSAAMLRGWHAHNGVSLRNPRLGFVCTRQTVDGDNGLEGFYYEYDRDLAPEERPKARERLMADIRARIGDVLTPEQKPKYAALVAQAASRQATRGRIYLLGDDGKPVAFNVRLGITDGTSTELIVPPGSPDAGVLKEGAVVITGTITPGAPAQPARPATTGPRMPF